MNHINPEFERLPPGWLDSPLNICVGAAKVPWAHLAEHLPCGWVLPGGVRTQDRAEATRVAQWIAARLR
jgi:hypothetical protein